jgi:MSHA biogenesis protein MshQ
VTLATNTSQTAPTADRVPFSNTTAVKFGMLKIQSAYGSAAVSLPIPVQVMYWNGSTFLLNANPTGGTNYTYDSCTTVSGSSISDTFTGSLSACSTYVPATTSITNGQGIMLLPAPKAAGSMTMTDLLTTTSSSGTSCSGSTTPGTASGINGSYLQGNGGASNTNFTINPSGRATFGVYSGNPAVIYTRESY